MSRAALRLLDVPGEQGRTTVTLLGSLAARLASLAATSGSDAVGSMTAGYAALGREASRSAEGRRLRTAIERSRAGANGEAIWQALKMDAWASGLPPAAVLQQFHNDLALLAAEDLDRALELPIAPAELYGSEAAPRPEPAAFVDYLVGMWLFGRTVADAIERLVAADIDGAPVVDGDPPTPDVAPGPMLR